MFKWLSFIVLTISLQARANDSGIMVVDVLGIAPAATVQREEIKVYGKDSRRLAEVLPVTNVIGGRSVHMVSGQWVTYIYCDKDYERPTNGQARSDWMCTIGIEPRAGSVVDMEDVNKSFADDSTFTPFNGSANRRALGIVPSGTFGHVFSVYGDRLRLLADKLPEQLTFSSPSYRVLLACDQSYQRPTTGEWRSDYMCSVYMEQR